MAKFVGVICTLVAGLCLVGAVDAAAVRNLTSAAFAEELGDAALEDPAARDEIVDEIVEWLDDQPARQAAMQAAFGDEWREPMREATALAVQTAEFETAYLDAFDQWRDAEPGESTSVMVDLEPTVAAVRPQLDPGVAESLDLLPPGFFVASDIIDRNDLAEFDDFIQVSRQLLIWMSLVGVATGVLSVALFRSPMPLAWVGGMAVGLSIVQFVLLQAAKTEVLADQEGAVNRVVAEAALDSLAGSTLRPLVIIGVALIVIAVVTNKAIGAMRNGRSDEMPTGSDTDWANPASLESFPQIVS
jgi:hypothetical protein